MARITLLCRSSGTEEWRELLSECLRGAGSSSLVVAALFAADQLRVWELQPANADHMIQNTPPGLRYMLLFLRFRRNARRQRCDFPSATCSGATGSSPWRSPARTTSR